jgi:hypothetical protein
VESRRRYKIHRVDGRDRVTRNLGKLRVAAMRCTIMPSMLK